MARTRQLLLWSLVVLHVSHVVLTEDALESEGVGTVEEVSSKAGISLDGLDAEAFERLTSSSEKQTFQAEVSRMMKLIINSLYRNKEVFLRELISNASDALDKIRVIALTIREALDSNPDLKIQIKADKENGMLHITDSGVGMSRQELITNLGTIAKSGTADFLSKVGDAENVAELNDLIGQFGVGFYSAFLVADKVIVTSKSNDDAVQHIWESDSGSFKVVDDPRGDTLKRGTTISLVIKDEARDFLEVDTLRNLIQKYSQFIQFPIYLWSSKTEEVEEPIEEEETAETTTELPKEGDDEEGKVEEVKDEDKDSKPKTKKVSRTVYDWELINTAKPIWQRKPGDIPDDEYTEFYKSITRDSQEPLTKIHFIAEGEVTFKALLYVPKVQPQDSFNKYGTKSDSIKLYVRRVFITDEFNDLMPSYLSFVRGVVDSDDLPLNVARETLQQHKLLKVIRKKLVRKALDMIKKIPDNEYETFWKEYSTNLKLGVIEDATNRQRLAKLIRFHSSRTKSNEWTGLSDYVKRMKDKQDAIYYIAGSTWEEVARSPFVERILKKGMEVLYLTDAVDEYTLSNLPEFEGKKFQNVAKEGLKLDEGEAAKERQEALEKEYEPLTKWLESRALKHRVTSVKVSQRLASSPAVLVASQFGWTGNMERLARSNAHAKSQDATREYYLNQKKILEINPRHPIVRELLRRVNDDEDDMTARQMAMLTFETATLRSGYMIEDTEDFARRIENLLQNTLQISGEELADEEDLEGDGDAGSENVPIVEATDELKVMNAGDEDEIHDEL